jgi:hypothetical protein
MVLIPVYEDPEDAKSSPFQLANAEPFTWQWLSTINRVNSQVQKVRLGSVVSSVGVEGQFCARHLYFRTSAYLRVRGSLAPNLLPRHVWSNILSER